MRRIVVTVELELADTTSHPRHWINEAIMSAMDLSSGEDITDISFEDVSEDYYGSNH